MAMPPALPARPALPTMPPMPMPTSAAAAGLPAAGSGGSTSVDIPAVSNPEAPATTTDGTPPESVPQTAPPPAAAAPAAEPEDLLKSLFDPLYRRLRAELRKDRDRRGLITDLRR
jgi:hypothetical protein